MSSDIDLLSDMDKTSLEIVKLQEEILTLRVERNKSLAKPSWDFPRLLSTALAVLAGITPLGLGVYMYRHQVEAYVHTIEQERKFVVTKEVIDLMMLLSSDDDVKSRSAALALAAIGPPAARFLIENLDIPHQTSVYQTISTSLRIIVEELPLEEREKFLRKSDASLVALMTQNLKELQGGVESAEFMQGLQGQVNMAGTLRLLAAQVPFKLGLLGVALGAPYSTLKIRTDPTPELKKLLDQIEMVGAG